MKKINHKGKKNINATSNMFSNNKAIKRISVAALLLTSLLSLSGCQQKTSEEHIATAKEFVVNGDQKAAIVELKNAIQLNPKQAEARFELGNLYLGQKKLSSR